MSQFRLKADTKNLGEYQQVTPETDPDRFPGYPAATAQTAAEARAALQAMLQRAITGEAAPEDLVEDNGGDLGEDDGAAATVPLDTLDVDDAPWKRGQLKSQPLTYAIPTDLAGGKEYRTIKFVVDFNDADSVDKANARRRQGLFRAGKKLGLPLKRASTAGREFTQANEDWITQRYDSYAAANDNRRITFAQLVIDYNLAFPNEYRSQSSPASYIQRNDRLRGKKDEYQR